MPSLWVDFVSQNKAAEAGIARLNVRRVHEASRGDATEAANEGWTPEANAPSPAPSKTFDPIAMIDRLVQDAVAQRVAQLVPGNLSPLAPAIASMETGAATESAKSDGLTASTSDRKWKLLDEALPDIPNRNNIPREFSKTLFQRYKYAETHGWSELVRVTTTTIKSRYWGGLYKFIDWTIQEKRYHGPRYTFECIDPENLAPLPRDAFDDEELLNLLNQPLFTGCKNRIHVWRSGAYLVQSHIYWGFLICILTGMRPGEVGQIKCADIRTDNQFFYFDLRPFDARSGRVALQDLRNLKTNAAGRVIPIHPLLIELGLLERMQELMDKGEDRLFPEWECYTRKDGTQRWSQPLSKSWQYVKKLLKLSRADLTLYSTRHLMADWLDSDGIAQRTRDRILGHVSDVRGRYGRKGILDPQIAAKIEALEPPVIKQMREVLLAAKNRADVGALTVLKTY
jgi:integrase